MRIRTATFALACLAPMVANATILPPIPTPTWPPTLPPGSVGALSGGEVLGIGAAALGVVIGIGIIDDIHQGGVAASRGLVGPGSCPAPSYKDSFANFCWDWRVPGLMTRPQ